MGAIVAAIVLTRPPPPAPLSAVAVATTPLLIALPRDRNRERRGDRRGGPRAGRPPRRGRADLASTPKEVEIYLGKEKLGTSIKPLRLKRSDEKLKLTFKAPGYAPQDIEIAPSADARVAVSLVKISVAAKKKPGGGDLEY